LELALIVPHHYIDDTRPLQKEVNEYLGGFDGFLERLYNDDDNKQNTDERIRSWAARNADNPPSLLLRMRRDEFGLKFITNKMLAALAEQRAR
jgi:hypothetical protein